MTQTTLTGDERSTEDETAERGDPDLVNGNAVDVGNTSSTGSSGSNSFSRLAPPEQRGGEGCCPWCLAAAETFTHHDDGRVGCGFCTAAIPVGTDWYERGEKIVIGSDR